MTAFYPGPVATALGRVPEEIGFEFDLPISTPTPTQPLHPSSLTSSSAATTPRTTATTLHTSLSSTPTTAAAPIPRPLPTPSARAQSTHRPRPISMPPQAYSTSPQTSSSDRERLPMNDQKHRQHRDASSSKQSRSANRVLGDYTLTKTLGAGSMGKVKLATHNITEEKVRRRLSTSLRVTLTFSPPARHKDPPPRTPFHFPPKRLKRLSRGHRKASFQGCL